MFLSGKVLNDDWRTPAEDEDLVLENNPYLEPIK